MLKVYNDELNRKYFVEVLKFARTSGRYKNFLDKLNYLHEYSKDSKCILYKDFAPMSFGFTMFKKTENGEWKRWFCGGLIFHGSFDGYGSGSGPTFSVTLTKTDGWAIHT